MVWTCLMKDDNDWVKCCITWEVEGIRQRGRPKKTWDIGMLNSNFFQNRNSNPKNRLKLETHFLLHPIA